MFGIFDAQSQPSKKGFWGTFVYNSLNFGYEAKTGTDPKNPLLH